MGKCSATLNVRELRFIEAVTADPEANATEAARKAGYSDSSDNALAVQGHTLLSRPKIQAAIEARIRDAAKAACLSPEYVLAGLMAIAERAAADRAYGAATPAQTQLGRQLQLFTDHVDRTPFASPPLMRVQRVAEPPSAGRRQPGRASPGCCAGASCCTRSASPRAAPAPRAGCRTARRPGTRRAAGR